MITVKDLGRICSIVLSEWRIGVEDIAHFANGLRLPVIITSGARNCTATGIYGPCRVRCVIRD
jgi:hypothetical protein